MHLTISIEIYLLLFCFLGEVEARLFTDTLSVRNGWRSGSWGFKWFCPTGYATGFQLKVEPYQGPRRDDSSINGIKLRCSDGKVVASSIGGYGDWTAEKSCKSGYLSSFSLRVAPYILVRDNTAANNIKFRCTDGTLLEGNGHPWGKYGPWSQSCKGGGICGIQTKLDSEVPFMDRTQLNNVKFFCCAFP